VRKMKTEIECLKSRGRSAEFESEIILKRKNPEEIPNRNQK